MRVALISEHASPLARIGGVDAGGQNVYVREVASGLVGAGHRVDVFTRRYSPDLPETIELGDGLRVVHVPAGPPTAIPKEDLLAYLPDFTAWMRRWMETNGYDVVHANFFMSGLVARDLLESTGVPYVVTFHALGAVRRLHQGSSDRFPAERVALEQEVIDHAAAVIAECPQDESDLLRFYRIPRARIVMIPCGVDTDLFRPTGRHLARARLGWDDKEWVVLHVGRMVPRKGVDTVIEAVATLRQRGADNVSLVVAGGCSPKPADDQHVASLMGMAEELGISDVTRFIGQVDHDKLPNLYGASDVFVTTPWYEPFGITPLEAMGCGLPVIGSNVGGIKFTVRDGETGFLVPPRDSEAVADRLEELRGLPWLASALADNARRRTEDLFTWDRVTDALIRLYEKTAGTGQPEAGTEATPFIRRSLEELSGVLSRSSELDSQLRRAALEISTCLSRGGKVLVAGNGGSASQAQHFAAELVGGFQIDGRPGYSVVSLTADTSVITAWANDVGFQEVFARQVQALGQAGDILLGLSTSGNSINLVRAFDTATDLGMTTIALLGGDGGTLAPVADIPLVVASRSTQRIQEVHLLLVHLLSGLVEAALVAGVETTQRVSMLPESRQGATL